MTIVLNELHVGENFNGSFIVAAADRQILQVDGTAGRKRKKLFEVPYLMAAVSYFGLAAWTARGRELHMSDWLPHLVGRINDSRTLSEFARRLQASLNSDIPPNVLAVSPSGFHIVGFDVERRPDFFFVTNIGSMNGFDYTDLHQRYQAPSSDFLGRDASQLGWDGAHVIRQGRSVYRNGDIRSHVVGSEPVDVILEALGQFRDFELPSDHIRYRDYVKFKLEILAYYYKHWARREIIARPIDVVLLEQPASRHLGQ